MSHLAIFKYRDKINFVNIIIYKEAKTNFNSGSLV